MALEGVTMQTFPSPKTPTEQGIFGFQFTLASGETISTATMSMSCVGGVDPSAAAMLPSLPTINGTVVGAKVIGGLPGNQYRLFCQVGTSLEQVLEAEGLIQVSNN